MSAADYVVANFTTDWDPTANGGAGNGTDNGPALSAALAQLNPGTVQRLIFPGGYAGFKTLPTLPGWWGWGKSNLIFEGEGSAPGPFYGYGTGHQTGCTILFNATGQRLFDLDGAFRCTFRNFTLAGLAGDTGGTVPPSGIRIHNSGGFGNTSHIFENVDIWNCTAGIEIGVSGENNGDNVECRKCSFNQCAIGFASRNEQAVENALLGCGALNCPTLVDAHGSFTVDRASTYSCGAACPSIPARPTPNAATDWMIVLRDGGQNNPMIRLETIRADGGGGQLLLMASGCVQKRVVVRGYHQCGPGSNAPVYNVGDSSNTVVDEDSYLVIPGTQASYSTSSGCAIRLVRPKFYGGAQGPSTGPITAEF